MTFEPPTLEQEIEIAWGEDGRATVQLTERVGENCRVSTHYGWLEEDERTVSKTLQGRRVKVKLGRALEGVRGYVVEKP
ncbi:hypothetical protein [Streptomyces spinosirectus]